MGLRNLCDIFRKLDYVYINEGVNFMDADINEVSINGSVYVLKADKQEVIKNYVIIRTYAAGCHAGELVSKNDTVVTLRNARRLYYWSGAATLSQLAMEGVSKPEKCKFPCEVGEITLQWIEIIPCTQKAIDSIKGVTIWSA